MTHIVENDSYGKYISYNYNVQGANTNLIDQQVIELLNQPLGLTEKVNGSFSLYPNPAKDNCSIFLVESTNERLIEIFDLRGTKVYQDIIPAFETNRTINLSLLEKGMYFINIQGSNSQRLIIE